MEGSGYLFALVALLVPLLSHAFSTCPSSEFDQWGKNCYLFVSSRVNFDQARRACQSKGADLISIETGSENTYMKDKMNRLIRYRGEYWIGMRKDGKGKPYYWVDGSNAAYRNWAPGEPNDRDGSENCVEAYRGNGNWNDHRCSKIGRGYVCKAKAGSQWRQFNNFEYYLSTSKGSASNSWYDGRKFCQENGGDLVSITGRYEDNQINTWLKATQYDGGVWVGLNRLAGNSWMWSDGQTLNNVPWAPNYPKYDVFGRLCGYIEKKSPGIFFNDHCDDKTKAFICKRRVGSNSPITDPPTPAVSGYCPTGYYPVASQSNKCYKFVQFPTGKGINFADAVATCRRGPGRLPDLASIHNDEEQSIIQAQMQDPTQNGYWIGLYRQPSGNAAGFRWTDSSPRDYSNWFPGEPSGSVDHCAEAWVVPGRTGTWNNIACSSQRGYVCQTYKDQNMIVPTPNPTTPNQCGAGYTPYWYGCYKVYDSPVQYQQAKSMCEQDGGFVVTVHDAAENAAIRTVVLDTGRPVWLGFNDADGSGQYKWEDKWMVFYTNWDKNQPKRKAGGGCVVMNMNGKWTDVVCTIQYSVICKTTTAPALTPPPIKDGRCPRGTGKNKWEEFHDYCYYFETKAHKSFADASRECLLKAPSASLVSIHSLQENEFVYQKIKEKGGGNSWTGLVRSRIDGKWYWSDFTPVDYENWAPNEPNGQDNNENCVEYYVGWYQKMWNDLKCSQNLNYVCKAPKLPVPTESPISGYCPEGWTKLGDQCFYLMPDKLTTWSTAMDTCTRVSNGRGNLATIQNDYEDDFVYTKMRELTHLPVNKNYWIGLSKKGKDEPYLWPDGSKPKYTNWAPGEPNDKSGKQNCVEVYINSGMWNDHDCKEFVSYVCKMPQYGHGWHGLSGGQKAGVAIGVLIAIAVVAAAIIFILFKLAIIGNPVDKIKTGFSNPFYKQETDA